MSNENFVDEFITENAAAIRVLIATAVENGCHKKALEITKKVAEMARTDSEIKASIEQFITAGNFPRSVKDAVPVFRMRYLDGNQAPSIKEIGAHFHIGKRTAQRKINSVLEVMALYLFCAIGIKEVNIRGGKSDA